VLHLVCEFRQTGPLQPLGQSIAGAAWLLAHGDRYRGEACPEPVKGNARLAWAVLKYGEDFKLEPGTI